MLVVKKEKCETVKISKEVKANLLKELEGKSTRAAQKIVKSKLQIEDKINVSDFKFKEETIKKLKKLSTEMDVENLDDLLLLLIKEKDDRLIEDKKEKSEKLSRTPSPAPAFESVHPILGINSPAPEKLETEKKLSRYIPLKIKRQVYIRANYQCEKCNSKKHLNIDHLKPFSLGGQNNLSNLRVLCSPCNQRERVKIFGVL